VVAVTIFITVIAAVGIARGLAMRVYRMLVANRSQPWRLIVAVSGLGYGLSAPLRGHILGTALVVVGWSAAASFVADYRASSRLCAPLGRTWRRSGREFVHGKADGPRCARSGPAILVRRHTPRLEFDNHG
jgi:hypothetical protein